MRTTGRMKLLALVRKASRAVLRLGDAEGPLARGAQPQRLDQAEEPESASTPLRIAVIGLPRHHLAGAVTIQALVEVPSVT